MKFVIKSLAVSALLGMAACTQPGLTPRDTGNMAYPAAVPAGNIGTTRPLASSPSADTGNMAYPTPVPAGNIGSTRPLATPPGASTGNMAYPTPVPNTGSTTRTY